jgi:hypothetical protein
MPINQKSSIPGAVTALGLSPRDHGAIASAIAPLMVLFINVASPRAAFGQSGKDKKLERFALYTPRRRARRRRSGPDADIRNLAWRRRARSWRHAEAAGLASGDPAGAGSAGAGADARTDRRHRLDVLPLLSG